MKDLQEGREPAGVGQALESIARLARSPWTIMEVCGGQTHAIVRHGLDRRLPAGIELLHGPGCPVCVTPLEMIDSAHAVAAMPGVMFCSLGDLLRVPGSRGDLLALKARGCDVRIVGSPLDALRLAVAHPRREVVFFAAGFEPTAAVSAMAAWQAKRSGLLNFSLLVSQVLVPPLLAGILATPDNRVDAFIGPGPVCAVTGTSGYAPIADGCRVPVVIAGTEAADLVAGILMAVRQLEEGRAELENAMPRVVTAAGNAGARSLIAEVFEVADRKWRGLGAIPRSGLRLRSAYRELDAEWRFDLRGAETREPAECISGLILRGLRKPDQCPAFGKTCTSESPLGVTMISPEGACSLYHAYGRHRAGAEDPCKAR